MNSNSQHFEQWLEEKVNIPTLRKDFRAGVDIPAGVGVYMSTDGMVYPYVTAQQDKFIGITQQAIAANCVCTIVMNGYLKIDGTGWNKGIVYYIQNGGAVVPGTGDAKVAVGVGRNAIVVFNNLTEIDYFILTTIGNSGPATLTGGNNLNIPNYSLSGLGGVPTTRELTINGVTYDLSADRSWTTVSSVGLSMPPAFNVSSSPVTSSGVITVTAAGNPTQYIRGDGVLAPIASITGGGTTVKYYLNGSVNQGIFLGNTYYQMRKVPVFGAGTNFSTAVNGLLAEFITNVADPSTTSIPAGNWIFRGYLQASTNLGSPNFYVEVAKWDGAAFTTIGSTVATPESITGGTSIDLYTTAVAIPLTTLAVTDRLVVRVYTNVSGNTVTLYTEGANLAEIETTYSSGLVSLNGLNDSVQFFSTGTSGTNFNIVSATGVHTFNLPDASQTARGVVTTGTQDFAGYKTFHDTVRLGEPNGDGQVLLELPAGGQWLYREGIGSLYGFNIVPGIDNSIFWLNQEGSQHQCLYYGDGLNNTNIFGISSSPDGGLNWYPRLVVDMTGNVGIGKNNPAVELDVVGDGEFTGTLTANIPALLVPAIEYVASDSGTLKYRTPSEVLSDIGAQGAVTLTTTGTGGAATLAANTLNIPQYLNASYQQSVINSNTVLAVTRDTHVYPVDLSGGNVTVTLPSAVGNIATIHLKRLGTNNILTVNTQLGQLIDGQPNVQSIQPLTSLMFVAYNNNWYIV